MQRISKVFTLMGAILALAFGLASCKANVDDDPTMYTVTVSDSIEHGTVTADKTSAEAGATVKLTATADSGYELDSYSVKDASANELTVTDGTFTMPKSNVTVSATFKETAETVNQKAAAAVIAKITAIGTVAYTSESKEKIDEARTAYDALTEAQKALVPAETLALLTAAESTYAELKAAADSGTANQNAAAAVIAKINAIGTVEYTDESKAKIDEARTAYDALTETQKALIPAETLAVLTNAESTYGILKAAAALQEAADVAAANYVIGLINALPTTVTTAHKTQIDTAKAEYDKLTANQLKKIPTETKQKLANAVTALNTALANEQAQQQADVQAATNVTNLIAALPTASQITKDNYQTYQASIEQARTAYNALNDNAKAQVTNYAKLTAAETALATAIEQANAPVYSTPDLNKTIGDGAYHTPNFVGNEEDIFGTNNNPFLAVNYYLSQAETYFEGIADKIQDKEKFQSLIDTVKNVEFSLLGDDINGADFDDLYNDIALELKPYFRYIILNLCEDDRYDFYRSYRIFANEAYKEGLGADKNKNGSRQMEKYEQERENLKLSVSYDFDQDSNNDFKHTANMLNNIIDKVSGYNSNDLHQVIDFGIGLDSLEAMHDITKYRLGHNKYAETLKTGIIKGAISRAITEAEEQELGNNY